MMRFHQTTTAALAALFVLPAAAELGLGQTLDLEGRLASTVRAIEGLLGVGERVAAGDASALEDVLAATEPPILDAPGRDQLLGTLRREVGELHQILDGMTLSGTASPASRAGLTDAEREALRGMRSPAPSELAVAPAETLEPAAPEARIVFEKDPAYTADALRQARLSIRAGRELDAIALLEPIAEREGSEHVEARYWLARAYDRAQEVDRALALYDQLAADETAGKFQERADLDRGFLLVKQRLLAERSAAEAKQGEDE